MNLCGRFLGTGVGLCVVALRFPRLFPRTRCALSVSTATLCAPSVSLEFLLRHANQIDLSIRRFWTLRPPSLPPPTAEGSRCWREIPCFALF